MYTRYFWYPNYYNGGIKDAMWPKVMFGFHATCTHDSSSNTSVSLQGFIIFCSCWCLPVFWEVGWFKWILLFIWSLLSSWFNWTGCFTKKKLLPLEGSRERIPKGLFLGTVSHVTENLSVLSVYCILFQVRLFCQQQFLVLES